MGKNFGMLPEQAVAYAVVHTGIQYKNFDLTVNILLKMKDKIVLHVVVSSVNHCLRAWVVVVVGRSRIQSPHQRRKIASKNTEFRCTFVNSVRVVLIVASRGYYFTGYAMGMCDIDDAIPFVFNETPHENQATKQPSKAGQSKNIMQRSLTPATSPASLPVDNTRARSPHTP